MISNFDKVSALLDFPTQHHFYFLQILQRKKDNPEIGKNSNVVKCYYIYSGDQLFRKMDEIKRLCDLFNARASINLNPRNDEKVAYQLLIKISNQMMNKDFQNVRKSYESVCGLYTSEIDKRWLVDVDSKDQHGLFHIKNEINKLHTLIDNREYKVLSTIETKNGYHIITNPFNLEKFKSMFPSIDVHKNNPTLLYCP